MAIDLPPLPRLAACSVKLLRYGVDLRPGTGGPVQRSRRLGARYAVEVSLPPLGPGAGTWLAALLRADAEETTVRLTFPQATVPDAGDVVVDGAGQTGTTLNVTGGEGEILAGSFFSVIVGGVSYLYATTAEATLGDDLALGVAPMLRASPANGAALTFQGAVIEGLLQGEAIGWDLETLAIHGISFAIEEAR